MRTIGEMLEWLKRHAWKACGLLKGLASSNLALSANLTALQIVSKSRFFISDLFTLGFLVIKAPLM